MATLMSNSPDAIQFARDVLRTEAAAVASMTESLDIHFERAIRMIIDCPGAVLVSGIGKAGHIARKLSATLASTGTPSHFLSPADAAHGDLGSIRQGDLLLLLSSSGESEEILRLLNVVKTLGHPIVALTATRTSSLGSLADVTIAMGKITEACPLGLAPSASTTAMLALGDALALTVMHLRKFTAEDFAVFHPGGQLGRKMLRVKEAMTFKIGENLPVASDRLTVGQVLHSVSTIKRRSGAVILTADSGKMTGIFTDGDLRRLLTDDNGHNLNQPVRRVMRTNPKKILGDQLATEAMSIMRQFRIDELPVVDEDDRPIGLIDVQDLVVLKLFDVEPEAG
jgi:arabinose-5-phosphate isomerase